MVTRFVELILAVLGLAWFHFPLMCAKSAKAVNMLGENWDGATLAWGPPPCCCCPQVMRGSQRAWWDMGRVAMKMEAFPPRIAKVGEPLGAKYHWYVGSPR